MLFQVNAHIHIHITLSRELFVILQSTFKPSDIRFQPLNGGWLIAETSLAVDQHYFIKRQQQDQHFEQQLLVSSHTSGSVSLWTNTSVQSLQRSTATIPMVDLLPWS